MKSAYSGTERDQSVSTPMTQTSPRSATAAAVPKPTGPATGKISLAHSDPTVIKTGIVVARTKWTTLHLQMEKSYG